MRNFGSKKFGLNFFCLETNIEFTYQLDIILNAININAMTKKNNGFRPGVSTCRSRVSKVVFEATVNGKPITGFHIGEFETINMALI